MRQALRFTLALIAALTAAAVFGTAGVRADVPYETYYKDHFDRTYRMQAAYVPEGVIGAALKTEDPDQPGSTLPSPLANPQDLFVDGKGELYVADTGNNRIVHLSQDGSLIRVLDVKEDPLNAPQGVFVDRSGSIYIADTGNRRIVKLDAEGKLVRTIGRPESKLLSESYKFDPVKLVVDKRGFLYIASLGGYQGLLLLDPEGGYQGFFGANKAKFSAADAIKRLIYTKEMYAREISKLPGAIASVDIGRDGYVYTVTKDTAAGQIKKLNIAGIDQLAGKGEYSEARGDMRYGETIGRHIGDAAPQLNDIAVDADGNMTVVDTKLNVISQYDANGNLLFYWGGRTGGQDAVRRPAVGSVTMPAAVETDDSGSLYVLDSEQGLIQKFRLSPFGALVHEANRLTQEGRYEESEPLWAEAARQNAYYTPAVLGLAKAAYKKGEYAEAKRLYKEAGWARGYSDAFWQTRLLWFQRNFGLLMNVVFGAALIYLAASAWNRKRQKRQDGTNKRKERNVPAFFRHLAHALTIAKQPIDGFQAIRYEGKGSMAGAAVILIAAAASYAVMQAGTHFIFHPESIVDINVFADLVWFFGLWLLFVVSHYLVSALKQGEGRFRDVVAGSAYALFPFPLAGLPITLLSNGLTLSESAIYGFMEKGLFVWIALLFFWCIQGIHHYSVQEAAVNVVLTFLTMAVAAVLMFTVYSLSVEVVQFIYAVYQEVAIR